MFSADFISGSRDFTQHLTSGELILIHSADVCILVQIARARAAKNSVEPWLNRVMQDHEARASDLNRKLIFSFFLLFS